MKPARMRSLPQAMRQELRAARQGRGWSQAELGSRVGLPQMHISGIESGNVVPRFDTLLDLVRVLGYDMLLVPRALVPAMQALIRDERHPDDSAAGAEKRPLYATDEAGERHES